jgi:hypothetical protein
MGMKEQGKRKRKELGEEKNNQAESYTGNDVYERIKSNSVQLRNQEVPDTQGDFVCLMFLKSPCLLPR